ncbi:hypothetical protein [Jeotgalibacillus salarius]|uniref:Uncharacterized protein n=1 Tax=Jeotgalibacillus salarius TaxID=546023 RepID=A0A4Y8LHL3_9BACL|nr:hypothetical protein [Jeotgalibacillus salarius]TFE02310.1 hypothetical protein E2626_06950 [Jeotgalibacillus salarius]
MKTNQLVFALPLVLLIGACNNDESASIQESELTERESFILTVNADQYFMFEYDLKESYTEMKVWVEKYENGEFIENVSEMITPLDQDGSIVFTTSSGPYEESGPAVQHFRIGVGVEDSTTYTSTEDAMQNLTGRDFSSTWGLFVEEEQPIEDELLLAYLAHSSESMMSSLPIDFAEDPDLYQDELEEYDVAYLLKAEFIQ